MLDRERGQRYAPVALLAVAAVVWPFLSPESWHFYGVLSVVYGLVALSVMVLGGWTGQISLGQAAFLGIGTYAGQKLLHHGVPLVLVIPIVAALGAAVAPPSAHVAVVMPRTGRPTMRAAPGSSAMASMAEP